MRLSDLAVEAVNGEALVSIGYWENTHLGVEGTALAGLT